jgi:glycerol-3-phosphate dehydrogenase
MAAAAAAREDARPREAMAGEDHDIVVIGGGINGTGIAADAAGRGLKVLLAEMDDLASGTSSASSKLIHGGLRYLEHREFRLVRLALAEREVLLAKAPHLIRPLRFVLPHTAGGRPRAAIRAGLFLYDHLARRRQLPGSRAVDLTQDAAGRPLRRGLVHGFSYWDCWVDDARLVVANARAAADHGATILTRTKVAAAVARAGAWDITLATEDGAQPSVRARALVNAAGPWIERVAIAPGDAGLTRPKERLRLVKGSHIVVPRIAGAEDAYLLQSADRRIVFALPFEEDFTLVGTTEVPVNGDPSCPAASPEEESYLLAIANAYFTTRLASADIVWRFSGVRPLLEDEADTASAVTRDYRLEVRCQGGAPLLTVLGGKLTTYRRLAEAALEKLTSYFPWMGRPWTAGASLPGGAFGAAGFDGYIADLARERPKFDRQSLLRLARRHGTLTAAVLGDARSGGDMGADIGGGLTEREVAYLKAEEWARTPEDVLWRRTKCGLRIPQHRRADAAEAVARLL